MTARGWLAAAAAGILAASACFSEHGPSTPSDALTCERAAQPPGPDSAFVIVSGFSFAPAELRVAAGTRVVWINCEPAGTPGHTTTAVGGEWDSPTLSPGDAFSVVPGPGEHPYHCRPHPFMEGRVIVE
jgi:plastocyanin